MMTRNGKVALVAAAAVLTFAAIQTRDVGASNSPSTMGKIAYVTQGVAERVVDLVTWTSNQIWGSSEATASNPGATETQEGDFRWEGQLGSGDVVEIKGVNGDVVVERASGSTVEVVAEKRARKSDPDEVRIEVIEHADGVTICAIYPGPDNYCEAGSGGKNNVKNNDVRVTFQVRVPAGVDFAGRTVNGDVRAEGLASNIDVSTVNGGLEVETSGSVEATTVNGSIDAIMESSDWAGTLEFSTVNGSISLDVPDDLDADLDASWVNGGLETDLPFTVQGRMSRRHAEGVLGQGGPAIELETVNGSIEIH